MSLHYLDVSRASEPRYMPSIETFYVDEGSDDDYRTEDGGDPLAEGWYWWCCMPGCLPDGEPCGPYETEAEAVADAREGIGD